MVDHTTNIVKRVNDILSYMYTFIITNKLIYDKQLIFLFKNNLKLLYLKTNTLISKINHYLSEFIILCFYTTYKNSKKLAV